MEIQTKLQNNFNVRSLLSHLNNSNTYNNYNTYSNYNNNSNNNKIKHDVKYLCKMKDYTFFTKNEIRINNILHLSENRTNRYITIISANKMCINEVNDKSIRKINFEQEEMQNLNIIKEDEYEDKNKTNHQYIFIKYNETSGQYIEGIMHFLHNKQEREYIYGIIESYNYIIKTIIHLQEEGIIYYNFTSEKMKFKSIDNPHCLLYDFRMSLLEKKLQGDNNLQGDKKEEIIEYFCNFIKINQNEKQDINFTFKSFEVHVLFYLYKMEEQYLSKYKLTNIISKYIENMKQFLKGQDETFIKQNCEQFMNQYINKNVEYIKIDLIQYYKTWDNYSVSILYLHLVENIIQGYNCQNLFMTKWLDILYQNVSQNPRQRLSINETANRFSNLFQYWM